MLAVVGFSLVGGMILQAAIVQSRRATALVEDKNDLGCVTAKIEDYKSANRIFTATPFAFFVVRLPDNRRVIVDDYGVVSPSFRGAVQLRKSRGRVTGDDSFEIARKGQC